MFHQLIQQDKLEHQGHALNFGIGQTISIAVRRNYLYEDAFEKLSPDNGMPAPILLLLLVSTNSGSLNSTYSVIAAAAAVADAIAVPLTSIPEFSG